MKPDDKAKLAYQQPTIAKAKVSLQTVTAATTTSTEPVQTPP